MKGRDDVTPLQERLLLLVHIRRRRLRLKEVEILAVAGIRKENRDALLGLLESYQEMLFPGVAAKDTGPSDEDRAKQALVEESKKVYLVKPYDKVTDEVWQDMAKKGGEAAFIAHRELRERQRFKSRLQSKNKRGKK